MTDIRTEFVALCHEDPSYNAGFVSVLSLDHIFKQLGLSFGSSDADSIMVHLDILDNGHVDISSLENHLAAQKSSASHPVVHPSVGSYPNPNPNTGANGNGMGHHANSTYHYPASASASSSYYTSSTPAYPASNPSHATLSPTPSNFSSVYTSDAGAAAQELIQKNSRELHRDFSLFDRGLVTARVFADQLSALGFVVADELVNALNKHERGSLINFANFMKILAKTQVSIASYDSRSTVGTPETGSVAGGTRPQRGLESRLYSPASVSQHMGFGAGRALSDDRRAVQDVIRAYCRGEMSGPEFRAKLVNGFQINITESLDALILKTHRDGFANFRDVLKEVGKAAPEIVHGKQNTDDDIDDRMSVVSVASTRPSARTSGNIISWDGQPPEQQRPMRREHRLEAPFALTAGYGGNDIPFQKTSRPASAVLMSPTTKSRPSNYGWTDSSSSAAGSRETDASDVPRGQGIGISAASSKHSQGHGNILNWNTKPTESESPKVSSRRVTQPRDVKRPVWAYEN
eukprot:ANDGO_03304.mRNA.1 hypothetical protein